ncbi:DinB family protein [Cryobacterium tagatosivorans]|uniref:DinB family protein n=1 Tax=Cryobacterium tagatosivorans TaxID=1259199 RepID=A0A4R8UCM6_9MICO|nr:DinB family protein [Cryobacterium tagatosivorans]TFB48186.1 DinB family protein [Cryobacterium tagatosivorans]
MTTERSEPQERVDPRPAADERITLDEFLDYQRATLLGKTEGLDAAGLNQRLLPSTLTLGGLLKHLALVEDHWIQKEFLGLPEVEPWASAPWGEDRDWDFHSAAGDAPDALRELYQAACERSRQALAGADLAALSVGTGRDGEHWNLRWILTHLIEETARHCGHADLLREAIDGTVGE